MARWALGFFRNHPQGLPLFEVPYSRSKVFWPQARLCVPSGKRKKKKTQKKKKDRPGGATKLATNSGASIWGKGAMRQNFGAFTESLPFLKKKEACRKPHPSQKRWGWVEWFAPSLVLGNPDPPAKRMSVSSFNCPICPEFDTTKGNPTLVCMFYRGDQPCVWGLPI